MNIRTLTRKNTTVTNRITNIEKTMIHRINRKLEIIVRENQLTAYLPLPSDVVTKQNVQFRQFVRVLTVRNTGNGYTVELYTKTAYKRKHWKKWRDEKANLQTFSGNNFFNLTKEIKSALENQ